MPNLLTTAAHFNSVRRVIDIYLTSSELPDEVIADSVFRGLAEAEVLLIEPGALMMNGNSLEAVRMAAVYLTAALILPALPQVVSEAFLDQSRLQLEPVDVVARQAELRRLAVTQLKLVSIAAPVESFTNFTVARARRYVY